MTRFTSKTQDRKKAYVVPSSRDSISGWLDVLTSMLALPESKRLQVRDELEDHLRSRVDDLLITGTPEPEAIRIAVAELGETAELAQLISHAHTRANPRRRMMNIAILVTAMAGMTFGGYSWISVPKANDFVPSTQAGLSTDESVEIAPETRTVDIVNMPTLMAFDIIADMWGYEADVHSLDPQIVSDLQHRNITVTGELTLARAIQTLKMQSLQHASVLTTEISGDEIELLTHDEFTRRTVITRVSLVPSWITTTDQRESYAESIGKVLEVKYDLRFTSIQSVGASIVVAAPPEIQHEIEVVVRELRSVAEKNFADRRIRSEESKAKRDAESKAHWADQQIRSQEIAEQKRVDRLQAVARIQAEFDEVKAGLLLVQDKQYEIDMRESLLLSEPYVALDEADLGKSSVEKMQALMQDKRSLELDNTELQERYDYLRKTLIESQYANLFEGLE